MLRLTIEVEEKEINNKHACEVTSTMCGLASKNEITSMAGAMGQLFGQLVKQSPSVSSETFDKFSQMLKEALYADSNE